MKPAKSSFRTQLTLFKNTKALLIVGPQPPPMGGSPLTVQTIVEDLYRHPSIRITLINTSPNRNPRKKMTGVNPEKARRMIFITTKYIREIRSCDAVLVFTNNLFAFTLLSILLLPARYFRKPFYIKPVGGDLDLYLETLRKPFREYLLSLLRAADGILVQTRLLKTALSKFGCTNTHYLPGFRSLPQVVNPPNRSSTQIRLIFLSHITQEKGAFVLLDALQLLSQKGNTNVVCDFYGLINDEIREKFLQQLAATPNARYRGVAEPGTGSRLIAEYDALILPTFFVCEGHPGVIIEAMHSGVPVISTQYRAIPELVKNGENGILVPVKNSAALAEAIDQIAQNRHLRKQMGKANYRRGQTYRTDIVVAKMLKIIFQS